MPTNPDSNPHRKKYQDLILRPEYEHLRLNFPSGHTWIRILPGLGDSAYGWILPILALEFPGGRFVHPASFNPNKRSVFDIAHDWLRTFHPQLLRSKTNKTGFRLKPIKVGAFWGVEYSEAGQHSLRLAVESFHSGTSGPVGLAYEIWRKLFEKDENDHRMCDGLHPENGVMVCVERRRPRLAGPPLHWVQVGRIPRSVDDLLEKVSPIEKEQLHPLERVIREASVEEQWDYLGRLISPELVARIRAATRRRGK